jgi:DNA-binding XRE family transcriptional regulator
MKIAIIKVISFISEYNNNTATCSGVSYFNLFLFARMDKKPNATEVEIHLIAKVKELRIQKGISQSQLAHLLEVSTGFIGHVESFKDRAKYNINTLVKLKAILDCQYDDLLP